MNNKNKIRKIIKMTKIMNKILPNKKIWNLLNKN